MVISYWEVKQLYRNDLLNKKHIRNLRLDVGPVRLYERLARDPPTHHS